MLKSLVADYDSASSEDEKSTNSSKEECEVPLASALEMLDQNSASISSSVFTNPYKEAENYEQLVLEKHVKMTTAKDAVKKEKKICFKFHKGKCKLGDNCRFLHHSVNPDNATDNQDEGQVNLDIRKIKKRCGLKDDLVPPKKYMKTFNKLKGS